MKFREYRLDDLGKIITGTTPKTKEMGYYTPKKYMFVSPEDLKMAKYVVKTKKYVSEEAYQIYNNKFIPQNSIMVDCIGSDMGDVAISNKVVLTNQQINSITNINNELVNFEYLYYTLLTYKRYFHMIGFNGSTMPIIKKSLFEKIKIKLPSLENQNKIVKILSSLDRKIELNSKIILNLEQLSSELYKRWFVDFEFPDDEGKPYKSSGGLMTYNKELGIEIPKGWGVGWFDDGVLTKIIKSGIKKFSGFKKYVATADVDGANIKNSTEVSYEDKPSRANMQPLINSVWIAKMQGSVKNIFVAEYMEDYLNNYIFSTGFLGLECLNGSIDYIWNIINSDKFILEKNNLSTGTLMAGINNSTIRNFKYIIPDNKTLRDYGDFTYYINRSIYLYNKNNNLLKEIRDNLMPKLLNGELDLDNIEI